MRVDAWTTGDTEFTVAIAVIYENPTLHVKPRLFLGNDPNEFDPKNEKMLFADDVEDDR